MAAAGTKPTIIEALSSVMEDVQGIGKGERNQQQGYMFRGIDAVVNAVGPSFRKHGVICVPINVEYDAEHYTTAKGTAMRGVTATISYRFYGPAGDFIDAQACGESSDSGDKAMPKAHSVAYRTLLLQALCIPTDEPDPDSTSHERAGSQQKEAAAGSAAAGGREPSNEEQLTAELLAAAERLAVKEAKPELAVQVAEAVEAKKQELTPTQYLEWLRLKVDAAREVLGE